VTKTQASALKVWNWAGALTGILWEIRDPKANVTRPDIWRVHWIPFQEIEAFQRSYPERKSLPISLGWRLDTIFCDAGEILDLRQISNRNQ
jgi:hypothetical protein